jgi:hypothetical protein
MFHFGHKQKGLCGALSRANGTIPKSGDRFSEKIMPKQEP